MRHEDRQEKQPEKQPTISNTFGYYAILNTCYISANTSHESQDNHDFSHFDTTTRET
jgi:hypothetical protein